MGVRARRLSCFVICILISSLFAQEPPAAAHSQQEPIGVPRVVRFSGSGSTGSGLSAGAVRLTFAIYAERDGANPFWSETQTVDVDAGNKYSVLLGATSKSGLPAEVFTSGAARWLAVSREGSDQKNWSLLVSVPYALKAEEADRLAGHDAGEFVLNADLAKIVSEALNTASVSGSTKRLAPEQSSNVGGSGTAGVATTFSDVSAVDVVLVTQTGTGRALTATAISSNAIFASSSGTATPTVLSSNTAVSGSGIAVQGDTSANAGTGIYGRATAASGTTTGVRGDSASSAGRGLVGNATATSGVNFGVLASSSSPTGEGVRGVGIATTGGIGVHGIYTSTANTGAGVVGELQSTSATGNAGEFRTSSATGKILVGKGVGGVVKFSMDANGNIATQGNLALAPSTGALNAPGGITSTTGTFNASNLSQAVNVTQSNTGSALSATNLAVGGNGVFARSINAGSTGAGLRAESSSASGTAAVFKNNALGGKLLSGLNSTNVEVFNVQDTTGSILTATQTAPGIQNASPSNLPPTALSGFATSTTDSAVGVIGSSTAPDGPGIVGINQSTFDPGAGQHGAGGVLGLTTAPNGIAIEADAADATGETIGIRAAANGPLSIAGRFSNDDPGGLLLEGESQNNQMFRVDAGGNIYATTFRDISSGLPIGGGGVVNAVTAGDSSITIGGTVPNPTVSVSPSYSPSTLGGVAAASYARIDQTNNFAASQNITGDLTLSGTATVTALGGAFSGANGGLFGRDTVNDGLARSGVQGISDSTGGRGMIGNSTAATGAAIGVLGTAASTNGAGVFGEADATSGITSGVRGINFSSAGHAVRGDNFPTATNAVVSGGIGVLGTYGLNSNFTSNPNASGGFGVIGRTFGTGGSTTGVLGEATSASGANIGVLGRVASATAVAGHFDNTAGGAILRGFNNGTQEFSLDGSGNVVANGSIRPGASDANTTAIAKHFSVKNASVSFAAVNGACADSGPIAVPGALVGDSVAIGSTDLATNQGWLVMGIVTAPGNVTLRGCRLGGNASIAGTVNIDVWE